MVTVTTIDDPRVEPCATCDARTLSICDALPHHELRRLAHLMTQKTYSPGELLCAEGNKSTALFNVTDGVVKLYRLLSDGRRQIVGFLYRGDFRGVSVGTHYSVWAEAVTTVQACRFAREAFNALLEESPQLKDELFARALNELRAAEAQILLLGRKTAEERVATFLLDIAEREGHRGETSSRIRLPMTRYDIADYLGLTVETVSRVLTRLTQAGLVQRVGHGDLSLLQPGRLRSLAGADTV